MNTNFKKIISGAMIFSVLATGNLILPQIKAFPIIAQAADLTSSQMSSKILAKYNENTWLGAGKTGYVAINGGMYRDFDNGSIYISKTNGVACLVYGDIRAKWLSAGGVSYYGFPTTDELPTPDGFGRFNHFEQGSIYWTPGSGACFVYGLIREKWASMGWETGFLGYPITDELASEDGNGRYTQFQGGRIYYHPTYGTYYVRDDIYRRWADAGATKSSYGYPTSDPYISGNYTRQNFVNGTMSTSNISVSSKVDLRGEIARRGIAIDNQGSRGTCSVFAMTFLIEYQLTGLFGNYYNNLSQEYLNHMANKATGRTCDGDFFSCIADGYNKYGIIEDSLLPYNPNLQYNYAEFDKKITQSMLDRGQRFIYSKMKLNGKFVKPNDGTVGLSDTQFNNVLAYLNKGIPVAIGRGHSMVLVGYVKSTAYAGGGYFIFRNSWGESSGTNGYVTETFQKVKSETCDAYVYERQ